MFTPELQVLKPINPSLTHSDDYEIFVLSNAHVVYQSNGKPASLLAAYADTPLRVEGRLEPPERGQAKYLVKRPYKPVDIVLRNVTRFSYGQMTDGELVIWALGEAGWFEIRPAHDYAAIHQDMVEAVELLYFITDIYNEPRKKGGGPSAQLVFQEYAEDERYPCNDPVLAQQIFYKHHVFLIMCFLNRAQGMAWSNTPLYQFFKRQYPTVFEEVKARIEGRYNQPQREPRTSKTSPQPAPEKARGHRVKSQAQKPSDAPKKDDNWWEAIALYEFIRSAVNRRLLRPGQNRITLDRVAKLMVKRYEIDEIGIAKNVLLVHAQNLCYKIDHPRSKSASFLVNEPIYQELEAGHELPAVEVRRAEAVELRRRRDHTLLTREQPYESEDDSSDNVVITPQRRPEGRRKKGRLSLLRPKSGRYSGKGKGPKQTQGNGKAPHLNDSSTERGLSSADEAEAESASDIETDTPTQALSPRREKRKFDKTSEEDEEEKDRRKRAASGSVTPESTPSSEDDEDAEAAAEADNEAPLPLRYRPTNSLPNRNSELHSNPGVAPPIVSTPLPTYEANGPRNSWICTMDGCCHRIYGAHKDIGRQLITEHLEDHANGRHTVVNILLREEEKLRLPIDNLLKKIREMSEARNPFLPEASPEAASQAPLPQPIRRVE